ncbi:hypothetical protein BS50DRAFT_584364 [Corynespora cassiicola Philippines]|uniref:Uncharacterized protein n=1 Tax=Corynespora cassiicola Philippines TaxID=1448308 RepID=A0A2T2P098_CORCC|nr:hypothetical protein BS50DRAFT_584364 [Corynespora cassiicola Philippines]
MHDFMIFLKVLLGEYKYQKENEVDGELTSVFPHIRSIFVPHVGFGPPQNSGIENAAYCMGMYRTRLPGLLSLASPNFYYTLGKKRLPPYGEAIAGTEVFHHAGTSLGHLGAMYLVPSTESAVVSLTDSQPLMDPTDFVAQLALSVLLEEDPVVDFVEMAKLARNITLENYEPLKKVVKKGKTNVPSTKNLL